ncbi:MAG: hypothetical protein IMZ66_07115, partial [Planctomycetes bacterium]|nr:hypothetical protein [Planctomycetota bacterium]
MAPRPPTVRVQGARILEKDSELEPPPGPAAPVAERPPLAIDVTENSEPPPGVADGVVISLDLVDARATEVLRGLAYQGNVDLVLAAAIEQRVAVRVKEMPWADAFRAVLSAAGLVARWEGSRVRVITPAQLRTEREVGDQLERQRPHTVVIPLQNLFATDAAKALTSVLSETGRIGVDEERNALVVTDVPSRLEVVDRAIRQLDRVAPQVMIEAIIVDVTLNDELHYGFDWTLTKAEGDQVGLNQALRVGAGTNPVTNPGGNLTFTLLGNNWTIGGVYDVLQTFDHVQILANPKVLAINNCQAMIEIIDEIPYQELTQTSEGGQIGTTSFKEVGIKLQVKPRIAADGTVHLELTAEQSAPSGAVVNQVPVIQTRRSTTTMSVQDGRIIALGGLRRHRAASNEDKIPVLGNIPWLGALFRRSENVDVDTELVVFIRPKVVPPALRLTTRERTLAEAIDNPDSRPLI